MADITIQLQESNRCAQTHRQTCKKKKVNQFYKKKWSERKMEMDVCSDNIYYQEISIVSLDISAKIKSHVDSFPKDISKEWNEENNAVTSATEWGWRKQCKCYIQNTKQLL